MQVTDAVIPGPTYLEAMEDDESGAKVLEKSNVLNLEISFVA